MEKAFDVLLVDDEKDFLEPLAFWLEAKKYTVRAAYNGKEAIKLIKEKVPNIVLFISLLKSLLSTAFYVK